MRLRKNNYHQIRNMRIYWMNYDKKMKKMIN